MVGGEVAQVMKKQSWFRWRGRVKADQISSEGW